MVDYMFSIAIIKTPIGLAIPDVLVSNELEKPYNYAYILSSRDNREFGSSASGCESISKGDMSIITSQCYEETIVEPNDCNQTFDFSASGTKKVMMVY